MKEIDQNKYFVARSTEEQEIINLVTDHFPDSGFPRHIVQDGNIIVISSFLGMMSMGYKHKECEYVHGLKSNRICIYNKTELTLIFKENLEYPVNSILKIDNRILIGTGIWGQPAGGELFEYNLENKTFRTCTNASRAVSFLIDNISCVEVYSYLQTSAYEGENRIYKLDKNKVFEIDYSADKFERTISDNDLEQMYNSEKNTVTSENLKKILAD